MYHSGHGDNISQAVQLLPAFPQTLHPAFGGGDGQGDHGQKGAKADGDIGAFDNIGDNLIPVQLTIQEQVNQKVQADISKTEQTQHTPQADNLFPTE